MPELPEVETVCRGLNQNIIGKEISDIFVSGKKLRLNIPDNIYDYCLNNQIKSIYRIAKYIIINIDIDKNLIIHLGMSGKIIFNQTPQEIKKHDHFILNFSDGSNITYNDPRRFGLVTIEGKDLKSNKLFNHLGYEPLTKEFNGKNLHNIFKNKTSPVKLQIMDNRIVVGVGNIYACESLFRTKINPLRSSNELSIKECDELCKNIKIVLEEAIESGGSTLRDYVRSSGEAGYFQHKFNVYGRNGSECLICNNTIEKITQGGRSTFYCKKCQKN